MSCDNTFSFRVYKETCKLFGNSTVVEKIWLSYKLVIFFEEFFVEIYRDLLSRRSNFWHIIP